MDITVAIDKLDKIGLDNVNAELREVGISEEAIEKLQPIINLCGSNKEKIQTMRDVLAGSETGLKGIEEVEYVLSKLSDLNSQIELDLTLARGLNYYTGCIFEVKALDVQMGSITGGGRYDNLTGLYMKEKVSGVGGSIGLDRLIAGLEQLGITENKGSAVMSITYPITGLLRLLRGKRRPRTAASRRPIFSSSDFPAEKTAGKSAEFCRINWRCRSG